MCMLRQFKFITWSYKSKCVIYNMNVSEIWIISTSTLCGMCPWAHRLGVRKMTTDVWSRWQHRKQGFLLKQTVSLTSYYSVSLYPGKKPNIAMDLMPSCLHRYPPRNTIMTSWHKHAFTFLTHCKGNPPGYPLQMASIVERCYIVINFNKLLNKQAGFMVIWDFMMIKWRGRSDQSGIYFPHFRHKLFINPYRWWHHKRLICLQ